MEETSTGPATILQFRQDIEGQFRRHIREALDVALAEELAAVLGSDRHERTDQRRGIGRVRAQRRYPVDARAARNDENSRTKLQNVREDSSPDQARPPGPAATGQKVS